MINYNTFKQRLDAYMYSSTETPVGMNTQTEYALTVPVPTTPTSRNRRKTKGRFPGSSRLDRRNAFELMPDRITHLRVTTKHNRNVNRLNNKKMRRGLRIPLGSINNNLKTQRGGIRIFGGRKTFKKKKYYKRRRGRSAKIHNSS